MRRPLYVIDSFSTGPFTGNPAAVLLDGAALGDGELQKIAFEMRHSETAFVLPARDPAASFHLRWLTPKAEVRFCGHATLAALAVMAGEAGRIRVPEKGTTRFSFSSKAGLLRAEISRAEAAHAGDRRSPLRIRFETPQAKFETTPVSEALLTSVGVLAELLDPTFAPRRALISDGSEGNLYLCLRDREALRRAKCEPHALADELRKLKGHGVVLFTRAPREGIDAALRCFFPDHLEGSGEDPVTGSASGQLGCLLQEVMPELLPRQLVFTQGDEVGRPGRVELELRPEATPGDVRAWIGGPYTVVLRGELDL